MTIIEQIKAEIKRLLKSQIRHFDSMGGPTNFDIATLGWVLEKISTIESEYLADARKTSPEDIEEAANNYLDGVYGKMPHSDLHIAIFIAGAKWQYQKDREEFAKIKAKTWCEGFDACKEQMVENALHGWLDEDNEPPYDLNVVCEEKIPFGKFKHSDKVRIIIVKED